MPDTPTLAEINERIAAIRDNLRELTESAAARSGGADEDFAADRIAEQEAQLASLVKQQEALSKPTSHRK
jgi:predicted  nucleic acid-binding Zn-ribbon protein